MQPRGDLTPFFPPAAQLERYVFFNLQQYLTLDVTRYSSLYFVYDKVV